MTIDKIKLTHKRLKSILDYNPNTGMFKWKVLPKKSTRNKITELKAHKAYKKALAELVN